MFALFNRKIVPTIFSATKILTQSSFSTTSIITNSAKMPKKLIWVDCEMTGLDVQKDRLLEIAAIITDENLENVSLL